MFITVDNYGLEEHWNDDFVQITEMYRCLYDCSILDCPKWDISQKHGADVPILIINVKRGQPQAFHFSFYYFFHNMVCNDHIIHQH
jgi:hypothetical protein